jgi:hypothetical protein
MTPDNLQCWAVGDYLTKHNLADVRNIIVLTSVDGLLTYKYGNDLSTFPPLAVFPASILDNEKTLN